MIEPENSQHSWLSSGPSTIILLRERGRERLKNGTTKQRVPCPCCITLPLHAHKYFVWLVAYGWCWFVLREKYCWLVADGWFVLREKYCWLVIDKPNDGILL
jgi:hypothetical protein